MKDLTPVTAERPGTTHDERTEPAIRPAQPADVEEIARIWQIGWADGHLGHVPQALLAERDTAQFRRRAHALLPRTRVAAPSGRVVGFVVIVEDEVEQLYVDRAARGPDAEDLGGRGPQRRTWAARLLAVAVEEIRRAGHDRAWLAVVAGNARARAFYARQGWTDGGPFSYLADTEHGPMAVPAHRYVIDLRP